MWREALQAQHPAARCVRNDDGVVVHRLDEASLQALAARNPVAEAVTFDALAESARANLMRLDAKRKTTDSVATGRAKGCFGVGVTNRDVTECNKRGCAHKHGQQQGGAVPALVADVAADPELRGLLLAGLNTQLCAELPLKYHAMHLILKALRVGARRDAAFRTPTPQVVQPSARASQAEWDEYHRHLRDEWWPAFYHHAMMVVANRHVHEHCGTCVHGKRGKTGSRMCAPWGHDTDAARIVELRLIPSDGSAPAGDTGIGCRCCHADGALSDVTLSAEQKAAKLNAAASRRDLYYTVHVPCPVPAGATDESALAVELRRSLQPPPPSPLPSRPPSPPPSPSQSPSLLPEIVASLECDDSALAALLREAVEAGRAKECSSGAEARAVLKGLLAEEEPLGKLFRAEPSLSFARAKLDELIADELKDQTAREIVSMLSNPELACVQGVIADFSEIVAGCTKGNAMICSLGAGTGSKATAMYQIKYLSKDSVEISAASSVLIDAHQHIKDYASTADDSGTVDRTAKHFVQRIVNSADMELEAVQAASLACLACARRAAPTASSTTAAMMHASLLASWPPAGSTTLCLLRMASTGARRRRRRRKS